MTKLEYLKLAITNPYVIHDVNWFVKIFAIPDLKDEANMDTHLGLYTSPNGLVCVTFNDGSKEVTPIVDFKKGEALFHPQDLIEIDNTWMNSVEGKITTKVGTLLVNAIAINSVVGKRIPYLNKDKMTPNYIEQVVISYTRNDDEIGSDSDKYIRVSDMTKVIDKLNFFIDVASFINIGATRKTITPPPGIEKKKKELLASYGEKINDPVEFVRFEKELEAIDKEYLKDDPAARAIFNKKSATGRKKMFITYGPTLDFEDHPEENKIIDSLADGVNPDPKEFAKMNNDLRFGSASRGSSTALSGYVYKILQSTIAGITISPEACKTTKGLKRVIADDNYTKLINRYIKNNGWVLIKDEATAKTFIGKEVEMRSSAYCTAEGNYTCFACMASTYKTQPNGSSILASSLSTVLMNTFLKLNHGVITELTDVRFNDLIT